MAFFLRNPMPKPDVSRDDVRAVQEMLRFLGYMAEDGRIEGPSMVTLKLDGIYGPRTEAAVLAFQEYEGILADGIVGPQTLESLEEAYARRQVELSAPGLLFDQRDDQGGLAESLGNIQRRMPLVRVDMDAWGEGYPRITMRTDAARALETVRDVLHAHGAFLTTSGGIRSLGAPVSANRSASSMHYVGRAVDLFVYSGMISPKKTSRKAQDQPYVVRPRSASPLGTETRGTESLWTVYARCDEDGPLSEEAAFDDVVTYRNRKTGITEKGNFLNLTKLFHDNGFTAISARSAFMRGGSWLGAEWWHFQYEEGLVKGVSTFGGELLRTYPQSKVESTPPWRFRDRIFGETWF